MDIGAPGASDVEDSEMALASGDEVVVDETDIDMGLPAATTSSPESSEISMKGVDARACWSGVVMVLPIRRTIVSHLLVRHIFS